MEKILVDWNNMGAYSPIPIQYRFVDFCEVTPGEKAVGTKVVSSLDWYFPFHFPGNPIMPGVLMLEILQQTGAMVLNTLPGYEEKPLLFQGCKSMRIYKPIRPGDCVKAYVELLSFRHGIGMFHGEIKKTNISEPELVCCMDFTLIDQVSLSKLKRDNNREAEPIRGGGSG